MQNNLRNLQNLLFISVPLGSKGSCKAAVSTPIIFEATSSFSGRPFVLLHSTVIDFLHYVNAAVGLQLSIPKDRGNRACWLMV